MEVPGLELLISSISTQFKSRLDALVATIHWLIIQEGAKCVNNDDKKKADNDDVASLTLNIDSIISSDYTDFNRMYRDLQKLYDSFKSEFSPMLNPSSTREQETNTDRLREDNPLRADRHTRPAQPDRSGLPSFDPSGYGVGDLDPLRAGRGGMVFDPFRGGGPRPHYPGIPGQLPPGAVPPGARFDPFGPDIDNTGRGPFRAGPDPDHMRPPENDWYM